MVLEGIIIRAISGFYYVKAADDLYECKAKGVFRKQNITPLVGDRVEIEINGKQGTVSKILKRTNCLMRPPVANIDTLFIVASADKPKPNLFVLDKLSALSVHNGIKPVFVFSKCDLADVTEYADIYRKAGFDIIVCSIKTKEGMERFSEYINNRCCAFTGNSGVGKSSIINKLIPELTLETNEISEKLGRGKHTTRCVSLYPVGNGFLADTPGFSSFEFEENGLTISREELPYCFPEFEEFIPNCKFSVSCSHTTDKGCAVLEAIKQGFISEKRHESYMRMLSEAKKYEKY